MQFRNCDCLNVATHTIESMEKNEVTPKIKSLEIKSYQ